jgi:hypothetical protein
VRRKHVLLGEEVRNAYIYKVEKSEGMDHMSDPGVDGRIGCV